ncbi:MAG: Asp-tRNA(Asn)/Glu-tRNA(Gln) amidotransferase subunit GatA [Deltaproteobacteria bacterium]|nr:Asp-tRNA(Asn)/Glu-tRNA(Gln) amidotransferase subunit GatA [Deltaproteobacteria bacterium]
MSNWHQRSLTEVSQALAAGQVTSTTLTEMCLSRIEAHSKLNAFLHVDAAGAKAAAQSSDQRRAKGAALSPLDGVPLALKDLIITEGVPTTAASKILAGYLPPYDGAMPRRLKAAGAVILGKTNLDEFAMGSSGVYSAFGPTLNPWDQARVPGGSSSGSAVAVAAGLCFGALGTDTGGSIRQPASLTGILGLKPTYSRVSRAGTIAFASSLDQVGPFGRSASDLAIQLQVIAGHDPEDSTSSSAPVPDYSANLGRGLSGLKVGVPSEYFVAGMDPGVEQVVQAGLEVLREQGATLVPISLPHTQYALSVYYVLCTAEASSNLARYDGLRYGVRAQEKELRRLYAATRHQGFGHEVQRRIVLGTFVLSAGYYDAYYGRAQKVRSLIRQDFERAFQEVDLIATPTSPVTAWKLDERQTDPLSMYLADVYTLAVNLAGIPGLSMPAGFAAGLPVGLQLLGPWFGEPELLRAAAAFERATVHAQARPPE